MQLAQFTLPNRLFVAPMAGVTDRPFRQLCRQFGAGYAVSEMVTSRRDLWHSLKTSRRADHAGEPAPVAVQIAGVDPQEMADAARWNIDRGAQIIDINMGCPAKKVCSKWAGSALMQNEALAAQIVDAVVAADGVLIPFGGGSNIVAALEAVPGEARQVVSMNLGRMNKVLEIDEVSGLAHIQAGVFGPDMEDQLQARGWTMGHHPDSFVWSTLGGWIATRSSGMQSDKYGDIADICRGLTMVMPGQVLQLRPLPSTSSGPSVREMVLGSEGRLGVITSAWVNVHRLPEVRELQAYFFENYEAGLKAWVGNDSRLDVALFEIRTDKELVVDKAVSQQAYDEAEAARLGGKVTAATAE